MAQWVTHQHGMAQQQQTVLANQFLFTTQAKHGSQCGVTLWHSKEVGTIVLLLLDEFPLAIVNTLDLGSHKIPLKPFNLL